MRENSTIPAVAAPLPAGYHEATLSSSSILPAALTLAVVGLATSGCLVTDLASMTVGTGMYEKPKQDQTDWIKNHAENPADMVADILRCETQTNCVRLVPLGERHGMQGAADVIRQILEKTAQDGLVDVVFLELDDVKYQDDIDYYKQTGVVPPGGDLDQFFQFAKQTRDGENRMNSLTSQLDIARAYGLDVVCVDRDLNGLDSIDEGIKVREQHMQEITTSYFATHPGARGIMALGADHVRNTNTLVANGVGEGVNIHTVEIITDEMEGAAGPITAINALLQSGVGNVAGIRNIASTPLSCIRNDFQKADSTFGSSGVGSIIIVHEDWDQASTSSKKNTAIEHNLLRDKIYAFYKMLMLYLLGSDASPKHKTDMIDMWMQMPRQGEVMFLEDRDAKELERLIAGKRAAKEAHIHKPKPMDPFQGKVKRDAYSARFTGNRRI